MSYSKSYHGAPASAYGAGQDHSWNSSSYPRETTSRAAEVLRNMSNTGYNLTATSATSQSGFGATHSATSTINRYAASSSLSPQVQPQQVHNTEASYGQSQPRPRSVNNNPIQPNSSRSLPSPAMAAEHPAQRPQPTYSHQQRFASPIPRQYGAATSGSGGSAVVSSSGGQQYSEYNRRQQSSTEVPHTLQHGSEAYNYSTSQLSAVESSQHASAERSASIANPCSSQHTATVDPTAVYDPWSEYRRKQDVLRAQKAEEDAARAEQQRIADEARQAEEEKEAERKRLAEKERSKNPKPQAKPRAKKAQKQQTSEPAPTTTPATVLPEEEPEGALAAEIRAMMAKMRELNGKDPALLARIWEEERKAKAPKPPISATQSTAPAIPPQPAVRSLTPTAVSLRNDVVPREPMQANVAKPVTPMNTKAITATPRASTVADRSSGSTFWPPEKRVHLAKAAASFLNIANPSNLLEPAQILNMLNGSPSYVQLCAQLENMGLKVDRAAFAKNLLAVVPDINQATRRTAPQPALVTDSAPMVPPAVMKRDIATSATDSPQHSTVPASPANGPYAPGPFHATPAATPALVAEMIPIKPELKVPANKEEAARKRNFSDLIDMTLLSDEEDMAPVPKKPKFGFIYATDTSHSQSEDGRTMDTSPTFTNFPVANLPSRPSHDAMAQPVQSVASELRHRVYVSSLDRRYALRRNSYNPATIARDVLLACGRHPSERQLNQHLDGMRSSLPHISFESDLNTIRWDLIDPGNPPPGYFKDSVQALAEDADVEEGSDDEERARYPQVQAQSVSAEGGAHVRAQALPEAINPFKQKRRGRPPRHSYPDGAPPTTPTRPVSDTAMSANAPRPASAAAGVGYQAFRSATEYGPDGQPLPKKKGRPLGWRKAIHGSAAAQARLAVNGHTGPREAHQLSQPSSLRNITGGEGEPIRIYSRSPSYSSRLPRTQSYKCRWQNCTAELHNLETLVKHVFKVHRKATSNNTLECLWRNCGQEPAHHDPLLDEQRHPQSFDLETNWRDHIQHKHFDPLSWELGDGPASGLSGKEDN